MTTNCSQLKMLASDGKMCLRDAMTTRDIFRLIESVPSAKSEPFKLWLANLGSERIDEVFDPEIAVNRAVQYYRNKGYSDEWIRTRLNGIVDRFKLTDVWKEGGITKPIEYALLTNEIYKGWSGMKASEYKRLKGLRKESLRRIRMKDKSLIVNNNDNEIIDVENIYNDIKEKILTARSKMLKHIDTTMTEVYWYVGKITYELSENSTKASYGKKIIDALSVKLTNEFGSGFSPVSIRRMRRFYELYPIWSAVPTELSWSHFQELIRIDRKEERKFYEQEAIKSNWGYRELGRQINTKLYDRYLISPDKSKIIEESQKGLIEKQPEELLKNPYIFEFAGLKENKNYLETDLEKALLSHLTEFLLELGRGFSFVANQQRIKIGSEYYYPDLVFYNRLAKCFVIIDLKIGKLTHQDIGQMQMYVNYYKKTQMIEGENEPIGILLCADKDDAVVEMTLGDSVKNVYASKYLTYMPSKEELIKIIKDEKELYELAQENEEK